MSDGTFSKDQVVALEKILGVKLPEQGFTLEIKPVESGQLDDAQLDKVVGGVADPHAAAQGSGDPVARPQFQQGHGSWDMSPTLRWSCKI